MGALVQRYLEGVNATLMAYGQTGSGKTHTMGMEGGRGGGTRRGAALAAQPSTLNSVESADLLPLSPPSPVLPAAGVPAAADSPATGILPRAAAAVFGHIARHSSDGGGGPAEGAAASGAAAKGAEASCQQSFTVEIQFLEVFQEQLVDLLLAPPTPSEGPTAWAWAGPAPGSTGGGIIIREGGWMDGRGMGGRRGH